MPRYQSPGGAEGDYRNWASYRARQRRGSSRYRDHYTTDTYGQAIRYACDEAQVPAWSPGQLRHNAEQRIEQWMISKGHARPEVARNAARIILGHGQIETTAIYTESDAAQAAKLMEEAG